MITAIAIWIIKVVGAFMTLGGIVFYKDYEKYLGRSLAIVLLLLTSLLTVVSIAGVVGYDIGKHVTSLWAEIGSSQPDTTVSDGGGLQANKGAGQPNDGGSEAPPSTFPAGGPQTVVPTPTPIPANLVPPPASLLQTANSAPCPFMNATTERMRDQAWQLVEAESKKTAPDYAAPMSCFMRIREKKVCGGAWALGIIWVYYVAKGLGDAATLPYKREALPLLREDATATDRMCPDIRSRYRQLLPQFVDAKGAPL